MIILINIIIISIIIKIINITIIISACEEGPGIFSHLLTIASVLMIIATLPLSLLMTVKVVQVNISFIVNIKLL